MMEEALKEGGFKVVLASSGERALQMLDAQRPPFRAVVADSNLGRGMSGWDVAKHAREIGPEIAVIYVTGHGSDDWDGVPKSLLLPKPFADSQLLIAVSQLLQHAPVSAQMLVKIDHYLHLVLLPRVFRRSAP